MIVADSRSPEPESEGPVDFTIKNEQLCSSPETPQVKHRTCNNENDQNFSSVFCCPLL